MVWTAQQADPLPHRPAPAGDDPLTLGAIQQALVAAGAVPRLLQLADSQALLGARAAALHALHALMTCPAGAGPGSSVPRQFEEGGGVGVMRRALQAVMMPAQAKAHAAGAGWACHTRAALLSAGAVQSLQRTCTTGPLRPAA